MRLVNQRSLIPDGKLPALGDAKDQNLENLPVIVLTALDDKVSHLKSLEHGGDDFLTKPFDNNILLAHVEALFRRA